MFSIAIVAQQLELVGQYNLLVYVRVIRGTRDFVFVLSLQKIIFCLEILANGQTIRGKNNGEIE